MAIPIGPIIAGAGVLAGLFSGGGRAAPEEPQFFGDDLKEIERLLAKRNQAGSAGAIDAIREELANAGLLRSGNLPDAITRTKAGLASQNYADTASLYMGELERQRQFEMNKYFAELGYKNQEDMARREGKLGGLGAIGSAVGNYFGEQEENRRFERMMEYFGTRTPGVSAPSFDTKSSPWAYLKPSFEDLNPVVAPKFKYRY